MIQTSTTTTSTAATTIITKTTNHNNNTTIPKLNTYQSINLEKHTFLKIEIF